MPQRAPPWSATKIRVLRRRSMAVVVMVGELVRSGHTTHRSGGLYGQAVVRGRRHMTDAPHFSGFAVGTGTSARKSVILGEPAGPGEMHDHRSVDAPLSVMSDSWRGIPAATSRCLSACEAFHDPGRPAWLGALVTGRVGDYAPPVGAPRHPGVLPRATWCEPRASRRRATPGASRATPGRASG
jgi:hypothetical protein